MTKPVLAALSTLLIVAAAALAAGQVNTYRMTASTSPTTAGTTKKPVALSYSFGFTASETNNLRPGVVKAYAIRFSGIRATTSGFPACTAQKINGAQSNSGCPSRAKVGSGVVTNTVGLTSDPTNKGANCTLTLTLYNAGNNHATLYLGAPTTSSPPQQCAGVTIHNAIDASMVRSGTTTTLRFVVPPALRHPVTGLDNALTSVRAKINRVTRGSGAKRVAFFAGVGGCRSHKRAVTASFTQEDGTTGRAQAFATCR
jgi:hypothetical protein